ncbi:hypothetical protein EYF80_012181 [Liparis tanakae]|uniref:Uncharacterized protein n=1 Tax=Liparis tanakae TaxID=230148 RepID=A0A4Z2IIM0_9TELE|nr:hypothetical protein EYF80_012181 [Liparis tanakae]
MSSHRPLTLEVCDDEVVVEFQSAVLLHLVLELEDGFLHVHDLSLLLLQLQALLLQEYSSATLCLSWSSWFLQRLSSAWSLLTAALYSSSAAPMAARPCLSDSMMRSIWWFRSFSAPIISWASALSCSAIFRVFDRCC